MSSTWSACAVCFIDIDHFGRFNKRHGDHAGDVALRAVARRLRQVAREGDLLYRKGGEEFVAILPHTDYRVALGVGERMREAIQALGIRHETPLPW
jgi:diguanylate cyclase (GGDEF)-like protein